MFEKNLEKLKKSYPYIAEIIGNVDFDATLFCKTRSGETNLRYYAESKPFYLHSNYNIATETQKWFSSLKLENVKLLVIYGIGLGYSYELVKKWLDEDVERYVLYIEDDPVVLRFFLELPRAGELLSSHQVILGFSRGEAGKDEEICKAAAEYFVQLPFKISALPHYDMCKRESYENLQLHLRHEFAHINYASYEFMSYGAGYFGNFYHTMLFLGESYWGYKLFKRFLNVPAIVCGAGPSLNKNFDLLKTLEDRAILFAGGSAINALASRELLPHFGGSVDPNPLQHERMMSHSAYELPIFYKGRVQYQAFHALHGPRIYLPGSPSYPVTSWFEKKLGINSETIREGHNVLHLLIELAYFMGCNPIIFVGMDLAYSDNQLYAQGVVDKTEMSIKDLTKCTNLNNNSFLRKDIYGNPVYTLWKWVAESKYTSHFKEKYPEVSFINATEGGLGMGSIPNISLRDVSEKYLKKQYDIRQWVHAEVQESSLSGICPEKSIEVLIELKRSLEESIEICEELREYFMQLKEAGKRKNSVAVDKWTEKIDEAKKRFESNTSYREILNPLNTIRSILFQRKLDKIEFNEKIDSGQEKMMKMCNTNLEEIKSYEEGAWVNIRKMEEAIKEYGVRGFGSVKKYFTEAKEREKDRGRSV